MGNCFGIHADDNIQCFNDRIRIYTEEIQRLANDNEKLTHSLRVSKMDNEANTRIAKERESYLIECNTKMKMKLTFYEQKSERLLALNMDLAKHLNIEKAIEMGRTLSIEKESGSSC